MQGIADGLCEPLRRGEPGRPSQRFRAAAQLNREPRFAESPTTAKLPYRDDRPARQPGFESGQLIRAAEQRQGAAVRAQQVERREPALGGGMWPGERECDPSLAGKLAFDPEGSQFVQISA
jgi:hypothetical protein